MRVPVNEAAIFTSQYHRPQRVKGSRVVIALGAQVSDTREGYMGEGQQIALLGCLSELLSTPLRGLGGIGIKLNGNPRVTELNVQDMGRVAHKDDLLARACEHKTGMPRSMSIGRNGADTRKELCRAMKRFDLTTVQIRRYFGLCPREEALDQIGRGFGGGFIQPMIDIILVNVHHGVDECLLVANHQTARVIRMNVGQKYIGDITRINTGHL
jgi:hypothetical protein